MKPAAMVLIRIIFQIHRRNHPGIHLCTRKQSKLVQNAKQQHHPSFSAKSIGPVKQFLSSHFQTKLPVAFLHVYIVTNQEDATLLQTLCKENQEPVPDVIVYPFVKSMYV